MSIQLLKEKLGLRQLIGESPNFVEQFEKLPKIAACDVAVLITGETGTGKELVARAIHYLSARSGQPFVPVNCGAIPADLVENELFGHEQGAFTSAVCSRRGLVEEADGGTLLLDEIDSLPVAAQVKLLRFLQDKKFHPLGSPRLRTADVRIIAATNADIAGSIKNGQFRQDLSYRLNVVELRLPPLRERRCDIPLLANHFVAKYSREFNRETAQISPDAMRLLTVHDWPGNVRELENIIERAVVLSENPIIQPGDIALSRTVNCADQPLSFTELKKQVISRFEQTYLLDLLDSTGGNITRAAQAARKNRRAFLELMRKHGIRSGKV